jgi:trimeric autotransporter adhesin
VSALHRAGVGRQQDVSDGPERARRSRWRRALWPIAAVGVALGAGLIPSHPLPVAGAATAVATPMATATPTAEPTATGTPAPSGVQVSPSRLTFGSQEAATTSSARSVRITNQGAEALVINAVAVKEGDSADFAVTRVGCGHSLQPGASCSVDVAFRPAPGSFGPRSSMLEIDDSDPTSPQSVALTGRVESPEVEVDPSNLSFGLQDPGTASPGRTITLHNGGSGELTVQDLKLDPADDFAVHAGSCLGTVHSGGSCEMVAAFSPKYDSRGVRSATLTITDNDPGSPTQVVSLDGAIADPEGRLSPGGLDFPEQTAGTRGASQVVTLRSTGAGHLGITALSVAGPDSTDFAVTGNDCPGTLAPGQACALRVAFTPEAGHEGPLTALLTVTDDDLVTTGQSVTLRGTARPAPPGEGGGAGGGAGAGGGGQAAGGAAGGPAEPAVAAAPGAGPLVTADGGGGGTGDVGAPGSGEHRAQAAGVRGATRGARPQGGHGVLVDAVLAAVGNDGQVLRAALTALIMVLPLAAVAGLAWLGRRLLLRRRRPPESAGG